MSPYFTLGEKGFFKAKLNSSRYSLHDRMWHAGCPMGLSLILFMLCITFHIASHSSCLLQNHHHAVMWIIQVLTLPLPPIVSLGGLRSKWGQASSLFSTNLSVWWCVCAGVAPTCRVAMDTFQLAFNHIRSPTNSLSTSSQIHLFLKMNCIAQHSSYPSQDIFIATKYHLITSHAAL